jgi:hypothetical protein
LWGKPYEQPLVLGATADTVSATPCLSDAWLKWVPTAVNWTFYHRGGAVGGRCECFPTEDPADPTAGIIATYVGSLSTASDYAFLGVSPVTAGNSAMIRTCCGCGSGRLDIMPGNAEGARASFTLDGVHVQCLHGSGGTAAVFTETLTDYCVGVLPDGRRYILFSGSSDDVCSGTVAGCSNEYQIMAVCGGTIPASACTCPGCGTGPAPVAWYALGLSSFATNDWDGDWVWTKGTGQCDWTAVCQTDTSTITFDTTAGTYGTWRLTHGGAVYEAVYADGQCTGPLTLSLVSGSGPATVTITPVPGTGSASCCGGCDLTALQTSGMHATFTGVLSALGSVALTWSSPYFGGTAAGCGPNGTTVRVSCVGGHWHMDILGDMGGAADGPSTSCSPFSATLTGTAGPQPLGTCPNGSFTATITV